MKSITLSSGLVATVDDDDYDWLSAHKWQQRRAPSGHIYARRSGQVDGKKVSIVMHRAIVGAVHGQVVDHINHDTLDNRKANLRICTQAQNSRNRQHSKVWPDSLPYKGVTRAKDGKPYRAYIYVNYGRLDIGRFDSAEDAARAYDGAARVYHGEFACLNFPSEVHELKRPLFRGKRLLATATHCAHGHEWKPDTTKLHITGYRVCLICTRAGTNRRAATKRAAKRNS